MSSAAPPCPCPHCEEPLVLHGSALEDPRPLSNWRWAALALLLSTVAVAARLHAEHWRKAQRADADAVTKFVAARHR